MRENLTWHITKLIIIILIILCGGAFPASGQEPVSGVINSYAKVNSIAPGYVVLGTPSHAGRFTAGDYVLLIQMQGVGIQTTQGLYGINIQSLFGEPGAYELMIVQSVNALTGRVDFTRNVYINSYNVSGNVQLIRVPFYNYPVVNGTLECEPWDASTGTGGVLAVMAGRKLTLNADIDVSGKGFKGAAGSTGIGECVYINETANNHDAYPIGWNNAGFKGEGIAIHDQYGALLYPNFAKGQGRNFSGGGGGNGRYSGGGGGSNRGKGGDGGLENTLICSTDPRDGGYGGMNIAGTIIQNGLFAGGGGGASTQSATATASAGGNGGGIVIIIADTIEGNNHYIRSNGIPAASSTGDAGAGGGGAGGSVALFCRMFEGRSSVISNGGNGGSSPGGSGEGGGGGGGLIWLSSASLPPALSDASVACGTPAPTVASEGTGEIKYDYSPALNGFLFNSVWSVATGNRTDSVCSNVIYGQISGTTPAGGTPPYTYRWESSTISPVSGFNTAPGTSNLRNYTPPALLTQTTWFRRVVSDNGAVITDVSLPVMVVVHPYIKNNLIGDPDTLCYGQDPALLHSTAVLQDGNGIYSFRWQTSTDNITFDAVQSTTENYQPPAGITQTTWFRRIVNSGSCVNTSPVVRLNVLETIGNNNITTPAQEICEGGTFIDLAATVAPVLAGGDNIYRYRWEKSTDGNAWSVAEGTADAAAYNPDENGPAFPGSQYYRRVVFSGSNDVCVSTSNTVLLNEYPAITNNTISPGDQTICSGSVPLEISGSVPLNGKGAGSYTFTWQAVTGVGSWADIPGYTGVASQNFTPPPLTDTTRFRRIVYSSACVSTSAFVTVNVHKPVSNNNIAFLSAGPADTTLCTGATPHRFTGTLPAGGTNIQGDYFYQWSLSTDNTVWTDITVSGNAPDYQPVTPASSTWFRRRVTSGECVSESAPLKVNVLPNIANNSISGNQTVCKDDIPLPLTQSPGLTLSGGGGSGSYSFLWEESPDGITWTPAQGTNNSANGNYQPPVMKKTVKYRRVVTSGSNGCCTDISDVVELVMDSLPIGSAINAGPDTIVYSFDHVVRMAADPVFEGASGRWTLIGGTGSFDNETSNITKVTGLSPGLNRYLWTVTRGACKLEDMVDVVVYDLVIPEGFSPNDDPEGYNNTFVIKGLDLPNQEAELVIISGSGTQVFSTNNRNGNEWREWDGKNSKGTDLPEGTYYYLLRIISKENGQLFKKSGFVVLKRY